MAGLGLDDAILHGMLHDSTKAGDNIANGVLANLATLNHLSQI